MESSKETLTAAGGINQLIEEVKRSIDGANDSVKQLSDLATIVNNFILQTLSVISDNENLPEVNQILVNSLIQVREFVENRPGEVRSSLSAFEQKLDAYEQCLIIINESVAQQPKADSLGELTDKKKE